MFLLRQRSSIAFRCGSHRTFGPSESGSMAPNLRWHVPHQPAAGYQVTLNGQFLEITPTQIFALKD